MNYKTAKHIFLAVVKKYSGKITEKEDSISFDADNVVTQYYASGEIWKQKKLPCHLELQAIGDRIALSGQEKSCEILGGFITTFTRERLETELKRYNYLRKGNYQCDMFDLIRG